MFRRSSAHHIETGGAPGRTRTGTPLSRQRILSPQRLPISPPGQADKGNTLTNGPRQSYRSPAQSSLHCREAEKALINGSEARSGKPLSTRVRFSTVDQRLRGSGDGGGEEMGVCNWCGNAFPLTRSTRKYCTTRCK